ncbi:MAG: hypothetical protein JWN40_4991 [Phycisphaerales bacterium]|nr:hypothetical protein [Phycisphaerales bacterium]
MPLAEQVGLAYGLARLLPVGHYVRKNLGYLLAMSGGAGCIYETDDDNAPNQTWRPREMTTGARAVSGAGWFNVYRMFTPAVIWPRGFPLERIHDARTIDPARVDAEVEISSPIQQGLADGSPDVDAVWRLTMDRPFTFAHGASVCLGAGAWCPFNSQSTWWWPAAYPLMYLPSFCTFRMTDIWRSFVAQRCLWELGQGVTFHAAEVVQERNEHDLLKDLAEEVPGYLKNEAIRGRLEGLALRAGAGNVAENLVRCYESLVVDGVVGAEEMGLVRAWVGDLAEIAS